MSNTDDAGFRQPWSETEREDFFQAIARRRRAAWRVTAVCALATGVLALVMAWLMSPILFGLIGLGFDLINLVIPAPDPLGVLGHLLAPLLEADSLASVSPARLLLVLGLAALPGLILMGLALHNLRRALMRSALRDPARIGGRAPDPGRLAEQRFANTIEEMALAAALPAPCLRVIEGGANAAAFGSDEGHATLVVGRGLIDSLTRDQMQGVAAHLIASIANGDMAIGMRTALTLGLFALLARLATGFADRAGFRANRRLLRALSAPTAANLAVVLEQLTDPFGEASSLEKPRSEGVRQASGRAHGDRLTWREWALMPLMGPLFLSGFLGGFVSVFLLGPAIALAWRQRKYMADATAVRLTRDPDALAGALIAMEGGDQAIPAAWAAHLCVMDPGTGKESGLMGGALISIFPPSERRLTALVAMGASPPPATSRGPRPSVPVLLLLAALAAMAIPLLGLLVFLLAWASVLLSMLFTLLPMLLLHAALR